MNEQILEKHLSDVEHLRARENKIDNFIFGLANKCVQGNIDNAHETKKP